MTKTPQVLCSQHACPAIDACTRYLSHHVAGGIRHIFAPFLMAKKSPRVNTSQTWKDESR